MLYTSKFLDALAFVFTKNKKRKYTLKRNRRMEYLGRSMDIFNTQSVYRLFGKASIATLEISQTKQ